MKINLVALRNLREDHDLKQKDVADILGFGQSYYSDVERGMKPLTLRNACLLADYFGVTLDYLLDRAPNPLPDSRLTEIYSGRRTMGEIVRDMLALDKPERAKLAEHIEMVKQFTAKKDKP